MDESSLIKAHDHAKAASSATHQAETTVAINEHALAAGEFANAARVTTSIEALRTLKLLEEHHKQLSEILKLPLERRSSQPTSETIDEKQESQSAEAITITDDGRSKSDSGASSPVAAAKAIPSLSQQRRYPNREMTSSIASNLASARGIRSGRNRGQPIPPSVTNDQAPGNLEVQARRDGSRSKMQNVLEQSGKPAWIPPTEPRREVETKEEISSPASDDGYSRFYSTFGSIINRLSAPLAFAGLPLVAEDSSPEPMETPEPAPSRRNRFKSPAAPAEPDLSKIYSRATLRSISAHNPSDSFYVVPTTGHTVSYANILNFADKEKRRLEASMHGDSLIEDDEDDFVDARETPAPLSPGARRRVGKTRERDLSNTVEELYLENKGLKDMLDKLSKRLHAFEASAQSSSMALAESMRLRRPGSPIGGGSGGDAALRAQNRELEEQLTLAVQRMEMLDKENTSMAKALDRYRDKWEKLKAGAKARRQAQDNAAETEENGS
ncbi:hypothetical protein C8034_v006295 [Colletotrichum sidae]|uniref:Uncharacterized protein n=1 Tax=Colletotrichum sidae TaxID=1347389 RepID=A0A4R8TV19_9PEZI|nr:hypothetical protein C8034_v006295 [Colletotrichum sidae]